MATKFCLPGLVYYTDKPVVVVCTNDDAYDDKERQHKWHIMSYNTRGDIVVAFFAEKPKEPIDIDPLVACAEGYSVDNDIACLMNAMPRLAPYLVGYTMKPPFGGEGGETFWHFVREDESIIIAIDND